MEDLDDYCILPSHPFLVSLDPLSICDDDEPSVWAVITTSILSFRNRPTASSSLHTLSQLIEDLSYSIHMDGRLDTRFLSRYMLEKYPDPSSPGASMLLNSILDAALLLPALFPSHKIPFLNAQNSTIQLSTIQIKCLLAHQILNTLKRPSGNDWGCTFVGWYSEPQALEGAVSGYLTSLFSYFTSPIDPTAQTTYRYSSLPSDSLEQELLGWTTNLRNRLFDHLIIDPTSTAIVSFPHEKVTCTLVASNSSPGFGASCTQEELITAACPPLLPMGALFISPPVSPDAVILVYGRVPIFQWKGQGRAARPMGTHAMAEHTFLFLDASEIDTLPASAAVLGVLPDLDPKYLFRDLHKVYTGFKVLTERGVKEIASPLWGTGAFGGDPMVKTLILTAAAARARLTLHLSVDEERTYYVDDSQETMKLIHILRRLKENCCTMAVADAMQKICSKEAVKCRNGFQILELFERT